MNTDTIRKGIGFLVFLVAATVYFLTVQVSVSFWDCGEFIASSHLLQVPHPPGTPFFLILGRFFSMIPFADNIAFRVNAISVLSSAFTVLFLYLVAVKVIENFRKNERPSFTESLATYFASAIGAFSLAFSSTFWFNSMEAEVYALATFFIAIVTWLMMVWNEKADEPDNEKYLLLIAYLIGLSTGVHLMSVLAMVPIVLTIYARKYIQDETHFKNTAYIFVGHIGVILAIAAALWAFASTNPPSLEEHKAFDSKFMMISVFASIIYMGIFYKKLINRNSFYIPIILGGIALFATYPGIVKYIIKIISLFGGNDSTQSLLVFFGLIGVLGYLIYWSSKQNKQTLHLIFKSVLFAIVGFSSYAMIIIRSNQDTPINLNSPKTFPEFVKYMNREQYGDQPIFKRRFTRETHQQGVYFNYSSDLDFFWNYQMDHMFNRYLMWNYVGKASTVQDAGVDISQLFAIPFLLALFGLFYHFQKDWKMASVFFIMFVFLGYLTVFYQNQQQPQPRERDYFYVGAFFVFSIWVALGLRGILELITTSIKNVNLHKPAYALVFGIFTVLVPLNMIRANYFMNDRSNNFIPWDYSYNLLQSVAPNAIIFTNGDNDTFPLWYLQDVEGVRKDVRVANLSLLNTGWYIKQLKDTAPHGAPKIKMNLSDQQINKIGPSQWKTRTINVNITPKTYAEFGITDTAITNIGRLSWEMKPAVNFGKIQAVRAQDIVAMDIVRSNMNDRPVYFAVTTPDNSKLGLNDYLIMEGLAFRVTPINNKNYQSSINEEIMWKQVMEEPEGYSKDYQPGFKFRGLNDSTIFLDENHKRLTLNYRNSFLRLSWYYMFSANDKEKAIQVLDKMEEKIPRKLLPINYRIMNDIANVYFNAGEMERYKELALEIEAGALNDIQYNPANITRDFNPYIILRQVYENLGEYNKMVELLKRLKKLAPNDPSIDKLLEQYTKLSLENKTEIPKQN